MHSCPCSHATRRPKPLPRSLAASRTPVRKSCSHSLQLRAAIRRQQPRSIQRDYSCSVILLSCRWPVSRGSVFGARVYARAPLGVTGILEMTMRDVGARARPVAPQCPNCDPAPAYDAPRGRTVDMLAVREVGLSWVWCATLIIWNVLWLAAASCVHEACIASCSRAACSDRCSSGAVFRGHGATVAAAPPDLGARFDRGQRRAAGDVLLEIRMQQG
jgi:hypothetical protein